MSFLDSWDSLHQIGIVKIRIDYGSQILPFLCNTFNFFKGYIILCKVFSIIENADPQYK